MSNMKTTKQKDLRSKINPDFDWQWGENEGTLKSSHLISLFKQVEGKMLTIADGFSRDVEQREAVKSLMRFQLGFLKDEMLKWLDRSQKGGDNIFPF